MAKQIIFDTNAYRDIVTGKTLSETIALINEIKKKEIDNDIDVFVSPIVWFELFAHLVDENDPALDICLKATIASFLHSRLDEQKYDRILANPYVLLAKQLFNYDEPNEQLIGFGKLVAEIYNSPNLITLAKHRTYLDSIKTFVHKKESEFIKSFNESANEHKLLFCSLDKYKRKDLLLKHLKSKGVYDSLAKGELIKLLNIASLQASDYSHFELQKKQEFVKENCAAALHLAINILASFIGNVDFSGYNINSNNRENWKWDFQILLYISKNYKRILVTTDAQMNDAAKAAGITDKVFKLEDYKKLIGF